MSTDYSSFELHNKVAIVTGPSQGIGRACAVALARAGAKLVLAPHPSLHRESHEALAEEIKGFGTDAVIVPTDVTDVSQISSLVDKSVRTYGRVDILVNNAGWTDTTPALEVDEAEWDRTLDTCLKSAFFVSQAVARVMISAGGGKIVNIGSNFGVTAFIGRVAYCAAKAGMHQLTRSLALEWAPHGVNVNAVAPALTETPGRREIMARPGFKESVLSKLPAGRWNQPEDVAGAVLYLSSSLADMVVGHVLLVDGGWTIQ